jgi:hypothetical protein
MTINPRTGLPEAFSLRKLFKAASFILPLVPIPGLFGMSSLLTEVNLLRLLQQAHLPKAALTLQRG